VNTIREAVRAGKDEKGIAAAVQTNLNGLVSFHVLLTLPEVTNGLSARSLQIFQGIEALGNNANVSWLARQLTPLLTSEAFGQASPAERDAQVAALVAARSSYAGVSSGFDSVAEHLAQAVDDGSCTIAKGDAFRVTDSDVRPEGCTHTLTFSAPSVGDDGTAHTTTVGTIQVITPPGVSAQHASIQDIGEALSHIPAPVRALIKTVVLNPVDNPEDAYWRAQPGFSPTLRAFMTAGHDGTITIYPSSPAPPTDTRRIASLAGTFTHEAAHVLQPLVDADPTLKALWDQAAASDDVRASSYAFSSRGEDFAESFALYSTSRLSPEMHAAMRKLMPQRFAAFDAIVAALPRLQAAAANS
jgi:hypothetical protein